MFTVQEYNQMGKKLQDLLILRYSPIAMKILYEGDAEPEGTIRPMRDWGQHIAMCQATGIVRRNRIGITMLREDHWCVWPLISFCMEKLDEDDVDFLSNKFFIKDPECGRRHVVEEYPILKTDKKVIGFALAPIESCTFEPEVIICYCRPAQLRSLLMASQFHTGKMLSLEMNSVDSCVHSTIPVYHGQAYNVTVPDPGEYERGLCDEDEMMFTMQAERIAECVSGLEILSSRHFGYRELSMAVTGDYMRPAFYNDMFHKWGLDVGKEWNKPKHD